jgi:multidrug efflux pump subunit AcrA (membrane-fusion protein)
MNIMKNLKRYFLYAYPLIIVFAFLCIANDLNASDKEGAKEEFIVPVFSTSAKKGDMKETLRLNGTIYSMNSIKISSKAAGEAVNIFYDEGENVKAGDVLLKINAEKIRLRLKQAEEGEAAAAEIYKKAQTAIKLEEEQTELQISLAVSNLEAAKALYEKAKTGARPEEKKQAEAGMLSAESALKTAEANYNRMEELFKKKTISQQQYDLEKMQYDMAKAQYEIAKENHNLVQAGLREEDIKAVESNYLSAVTSLKIAESLKLKLDLLRNDMKAALSNMKQAEYERKIAGIMLDDTYVRAPINGVISKKFIKEGEIIQSPGIPLFTLLDQKNMKAMVNIPEKNISKIKKGLEALVKIDSYPDKTFSGTIAKSGASLDMKLRTLEVEITISNEGGLLKEGMFARVSIYTDIHKDAVYVPVSAVVKKDGKKFVFIVKGDSPIKKPVTTGIVEGDKVEILSGIANGDEVIYRGNSRLEEDMKVFVENK